MVLRLLADLRKPKPWKYELEPLLRQEPHRPIVVADSSHFPDNSSCHAFVVFSPKGAKDDYFGVRHKNVKGAVNERVGILNYGHLPWNADGSINWRKPLFSDMSNELERGSVQAEFHGYEYCSKVLMGRQINNYLMLIDSNRIYMRLVTDVRKDKTSDPSITNAQIAELVERMLDAGADVIEVNNKEVQVAHFLHRGVLGLSSWRKRYWKEIPDQISFKNEYYRLRGIRHYSTQIKPLADNSDSKLLGDPKVKLIGNSAFYQKEIYAVHDTSQEDRREAAYAWHNDKVALKVPVVAWQEGTHVEQGQRNENASYNQVVEGFNLLTSNESEKGITVNLFGGIIMCDVAVSGMVNAAKQINPLAETFDSKLLGDPKVNLIGNSAFCQKEMYAVHDTSQEDLQEVALKVPVVAWQEGTQVEQGQRNESVMAVLGAECLDDVADF